jgi:hypothetical protein
MIYYRKYIIQYLDIPGVYSICVDSEVDYMAFYMRFFGNNPEGRKDHQHVRNCLRYELESMASDGIIEKEVRDVRNQHNNLSKRKTFYIKKHKEWDSHL